VLCAPGSVLLEASTSRPAQINWYDTSDFGNVDSLGTGNIFPVDIESGMQTYYAVAFSPEGCNEVDSIKVSVKDLFDESGLGELPDTTLRACINTPAMLPLNPDFTYEWAPLDEGIDASDPANPVFTLSDNRSYSVTITDPVSTCSDTVDIKVELNPELNLVVAEGDTLCTETSVTLNAGTAIPSTIEWSGNPNFDPVEGTGSNFTVTPPLGSTVYYVRATDTSALGCTAIDSVQVDFYPIDAELPPVVSCEPAATLELEVINLDTAQQLEYMWFPEQAVVSDPTTGPTATVDPALATEFSVDLVNQYGCSATLSTTAQVIDLPDIIDVTAEPDTICNGASSVLSVTGCEDCSYSWSPAATLDLPDSPNPTATPEGTTTYTVTVEKEGCQTSASVTVTVIECECGPPFVYLPNAFTPNGDGVNDVLYVRGNNIDRVNLIIFNRWGQKVFASNSQEEGWDGTFQGRELPPDVYGYYLEVQCGDEIYREQGNVTLLR